MNKSPHIVGGGLGTFRKDGRAKAIAKQQAEQRAAELAVIEQREVNRRAAMAKIVKSK